MISDFRESDNAWNTNKSLYKKKNYGIRLKTNCFHSQLLTVMLRYLTSPLKKRKKLKLFKTKYKNLYKLFNFITNINVSCYFSQWTSCSHFERNILIFSWKIYANHLCQYSLVQIKDWWNHWLFSFIKNSEIALIHNIFEI